MKNNKFLFKIYLSLIIISAVSIIALSILGRKARIGYLSEFKFDISHINRTLELNNLSYIKELFTKDRILDEEGIKNYIFTNESITNYSYGFKVQYYDKVFRHSDIYNVYIDTNKVLKDNDFIEEINIYKGSPFGNLISSEKIEFDKIDNVDYILKIKSNIISIFIIIFIIIPILYFAKVFHNVKKIILILYSLDNKITLKKYFNYALKNTFSLFKEKDIKYIILIITCLVFSIIEIIFRFNLFFPGNYIFGDFSSNILPQSLGIINFSHIFPVFISVFFRILNIVFGNHVWYFFLINLILWYIGLLFLIMSVYNTTKSLFSILLIFLTFLSNIWWFLPDLHKDYTYSMFIWVYLNIILFMELGSYRSPNLFLLITSFLFIFAFLWSHTAIVTLTPFLIYWVHVYLLKCNYNFLSKQYIFNFIKSFICICIFLVFVYKAYPSLIPEGRNKGMTWHIPLHDILSISYLIDKDLLPESAYGEKVNFETIKSSFSHYTIDNLIWNSDNRYNLLEPDLDNFKLYWLKIVFKYPKEYIYHKLIFAKGLLFFPGIERIRSDSDNNNLYGSKIAEFIPKNELAVKYTEQEKQFLIFLEKNIFDILFIKPVYFFIISLICFILSIIFLIKKKGSVNLNILVLSISSSSISTIFITILYSPHSGYRYIFAVIPMTIIGLASIIISAANKIKFEA